MKNLFENWRKHINESDKTINENRKIVIDETPEEDRERAKELAKDATLSQDREKTQDRERAKQLAQDTAIAQDREKNPQDAYGNIPSAVQGPPAPDPKPKRKVKGSNKMRKYINSLLKNGKIDKALWKKARRALYKGDAAASAVLKNNIEDAGGTPGKTTSDPKFVAHIAKQMGGAGSLTNQLKEPLKSKYQAKYVEMMKAADRSQPNYRQKILMTLNGQLAKTGTLEENRLSHNMIVDAINEVLQDEVLKERFDPLGLFPDDDQERAADAAQKSARDIDATRYDTDKYGDMPGAELGAKKGAIHSRPSGKHPNINPGAKKPTPKPKRKIASGKMRQQINQMLKSGKIDKATWTKARRALYKSTDAAQAVLDSAKGAKKVGPDIPGAAGATTGQTGMSKKRAPESPALEEIRRAIREVLNEK